MYNSTTEESDALQPPILFCTPQTRTKKKKKKSTETSVLPSIYICELYQSKCMQ